MFSVNLAGSSPDERLLAAHVEFIKLCKEHRVRSLTIGTGSGHGTPEAVEGRCSRCLLACILRPLTLSELRKHLQGDKTTFPTIAQKHLNGTEPDSVRQEC